MTKHESFKRRIRERMAKTGERYTAARRSLTPHEAIARRRVWISEPEFSDEVIRDNTERSWDDWCDVIDAWPGHAEGHTAIASFVRDELGIDAWWAQGVTVGYERITGLRLPHQRPDGTFTADKSKTVTVEASWLREMLLDDTDRRDLFGGEPTELRSRPGSKSIRLSVGPGVALVSLEPKLGERTRITISHERLPEFQDVAEWKFFWNEWLTALDDAHQP